MPHIVVMKIRIRSTSRSVPSPRRLPVWAVWAAVAVAAVVFFVCSPEAVPFFPRCPFHVLTGLQCPGCGLQRAVHSLLHLDLAAAFRHNALFVSVLPYVAFLGLASRRRHRWPRLYASLTGPVAICLVATVTAFWFVGRNVWGW